MDPSIRPCLPRRDLHCGTVGFSLKVLRDDVWYARIPNEGPIQGDHLASALDKALFWQVST